MNRLTFGVNLPTSAAAGADPVGYARAAEALGFDFVSASDHPAGDYPTYETWTLLSWVAAATSRISVASRVLSIPFRSPALVAKMAESLDRLSEGRLILGLGGGAADAELYAFGLPIPTAREKVDGMSDALHVIRGLWQQRRHTHTGAIHRTVQAEMEPKPAHRIPIWLGTFGDRALAVTGRQADGWIPSLGHLPIDQLQRKRRIVLSVAESAGRSPDEITCALNVQVSIDGIPEPGSTVLAGPAEQVAESIAGFVDLGFNAFNFMPVGDRPIEQIERLATDVMQALPR